MITKHDGNQSTGAALQAHLHGLYVITDEQMAGHQSAGNHERVTRAAIAGGATLIQLRAKTTPEVELIAIGHRLRKLTREAKVLLLVNDDPQLAIAIEADGVHLGPDDMPLREARRVLGTGKIIGVSCGDESEARAAFADGASYVGGGAVFATSTKLDAGAPIGLERLRRIVQATPLPVAAIGGINERNIASLRSSGVKMACVISAVTQAGDELAMAGAVRSLAEKFAAAS